MTGMPGMLEVSPVIRWLVTDIPMAFLKALLQVAPQVYAEAHARTYGDPLFGRRSPEAHDLIGHERHALFQSRIPKIAEECGLSYAVALNSRGTSHYRLIRAGHFVLTASAVSSPNEQPRFAHFRKRNANINRLLAQRVLAFMPMAEVQSDKPASNGIIIHGPHAKNPKECGFMKIGIPSPSLTRWMFCESVEYLIAAQLSEAATIASENVVDNVHPRRRKDRRMEGEGA
jgi:hypothetical protein